MNILLSSCPFVDAALAALFYELTEIDRCEWGPHQRTISANKYRPLSINNLFSVHANAIRTQSLCCLSSGNSIPPQIE